VTKGWMVVLILSLTTTLGANTNVASVIQQQRQAATARTHFIPFYSLQDGDDTELFFVSKMTDPLSIDVFVTSSGGERLYLGRETLPPSRNLSISLRDRLTAAGPAFGTGSLRFDFVGDAGALQAWAIVRSGRQSFEVPFIPADKIAVHELISYWDTDQAGPRPKLRVEYHLTNTTIEPVPYTLALSRGARNTRIVTGTLAPLETQVQVVSDGETTHRGWLRLTHSGPAGAVIGAGILSGDERLVYLPLVTRDSTQKGPGFEILRVPEAAATPARTQLTLFNSSDADEIVEIEALSQTTGAVSGRDQVKLGAWEVLAYDATKLVQTSPMTGVRLRVRGSSAALMVDGVVVTPAGDVLDLSTHAASSAHKSGTYPIPDLDRYSVRTTIINVGTGDSEIAAQYFWDGGTYSVPLFRIAAGATAVLDPAQIAEDARLDTLHRTLDPGGKHMSLKWGVRSGSKQLIGRTEARLRTRTDGFGFNCGGCCWSIPGAAIVPNEIEFGLGESPSFVSVVYYDTCSGRLGPWSVGGTSYVPSPFSWNFSNISTSDGADDDIGFETNEEQTSFLCIVTSEPVGASGRAKTCDKIYNFNGYDKDRPCVEQTTTCGSCLLCCNSLFNAAVCKGADRDAAVGERNACYGTCAISFQNCDPPQ